MGQTHRRIDLIDADRHASRSCFFLRAIDALDVSAQRGAASPLEASRAPLSTRAIRRPGGRAEDAIAEETFPHNTGVPGPSTDSDAALARLTPVASAVMAEVHAS